VAHRRHKVAHCNHAGSTVRSERGLAMAQENNGMPPRADRKLTRSERFWVAGMAHVDPRTVDTYLAGGPMMVSSRERIEAAIVALDGAQ